jgi:hypothetical protein
VAISQAASIAARIRSRLQVGHNGAIIEQGPDDNVRLAGAEFASSARGASETYQTWRTKIVFARSHEPNRSSVMRVLRQSRHEDHAYARTRFARRD